MNKSVTILSVVLAAAALLLAIFALVQIKSVRQLALSELVIEEHDSLSAPVFDEEKQTFSFVTLFDISITNHSGPAVTLTSVQKIPSSKQFLTLLKNEEIVNADVQTRAFPLESSSAEVQANPRMLKTLMSQDMGESANFNVSVAPGATKIFHLGVALSPYNVEKQAVATAALCSFELKFDNGKTYIFRRAFPITPLQ
jgi:hypothetical protein